MIDDGRIQDAKSILGLMRVLSADDQWRKNQLAINTSAALIFFGYTLVMPFSPRSSASWASPQSRHCSERLILSCSPLVAALCGPIWGRLGDRWGLKIMAQRATVANALLWFSMGFAQNVYQLLALRALLGLLGGFNSVSVALITQSAPREKVTGIVGTLQAVQILQQALALCWRRPCERDRRSPHVLCDRAGMPGAVISVFALYRDAEYKTKNAEEPGKKSRFWQRPQFLTTLLVLFFVNMADRPSV
jgi:MFS family permease